MYKIYKTPQGELVLNPNKITQITYNVKDTSGFFISGFIDELHIMHDGTNNILTFHDESLKGLFEEIKSEMNITA